MKKIIGLLLALLLVTMLPVSAAADKDIVDTAVANGSFKTLVAALQEAKLVDTLKGEGPFTVFAPTDAAFEKLLKQLDITAAQLLAHPDLAKVLTFHVVSGAKVMSTDLTDGQKVKTVNGEELTIGVMSGSVTVNTGSKVVIADVDTTNGVIHAIDTVLVPANFTLGSTEELPDTSNAATAGLVALFAILGAGLVIVSRPKAVKA
jgi:uncharacterized surface protein with fasciclin (FAS1) repeats